MQNQKLVVNILPNESLSVFSHHEHGYLMSTKEVAKGYGIARNSIAKVHTRNSSEFIEGIHFVKGVTVCPTLSNIQPHATYYTKAGVLRFGFFVKSPRGVAFRDLAENLLLNALDQNRPKPSKINLPTTKKRNHKRLTANKQLEMALDFAEVEPKELRMKLIRKYIKSL